MSPTRSAKSYGQLSTEQKSLVAEKRIDATHLPGEWVQMLSELAAYDQAGDSQRSRVGWGCGLSIAVTIITVFIYPPAAAAPLVLAIVFVVLYRRMKKHDVPNELRDAILPLLALLREDMEPSSPLRLMVDLRPAERQENQKSSRNVSRSDNPKVTESMYHNAWIEVACTLADGTTLEFGIADLIRERKVIKRNPRGKMKVKHKYKVRRVVEMRVGLRRDQYAWQPIAEQQTGLRVARKEGAKRNVVKVRRMITASGSPKPPLEVHDVIDTLARAYRRVALVDEEGNKS